MKKLVSLLLAVAMLLGVASFAVAEEEKPWKGQTIIVWNDFANNLINQFDVWGQPVNPFAVANAAIEEWEAKNECEVLMVGKGAEQFAAAVAGGNTPDLVITYSTFPGYQNQGLVQPLTKEQETELRTLFGDGFVNPLMHAGESYGIVQPWGGNYVILYNRTMMEDMGIKTPREYYLEGNWNYETFAQVMKECTQDIDGDGKLDTQAVYRNSFNLAMMPGIIADENGGYVTDMGDERSMAFYNMLYEAYTINDAIHLGSGSSGLTTAGKDGAYVMMKFQQQSPWMLNNMLYEDNAGYVIEAVPTPEWKEGDTQKTEAINYTYLNIAKGAKNADAAYDLMKFIIECGLKEMADYSGGLVEFPFEGLTGCTEFTKDYIAARQAKVDELNAASRALPEYDAEYFAAVCNYFMKEANYHMQLNLPGVSNLFDQGQDCYTLPTATFIAQTAPIFEAQLEAYNNQYVYD